MKKKIQKKEVSKNYFSNMKAILITLGIPVIVALIYMLLSNQEYPMNIFAGFLLGFIFELPIIGLGSYLLKFGNKKEEYRMHNFTFKRLLLILLILFMLSFIFVTYFFNVKEETYYFLALIEISLVLTFVIEIPILTFLYLTKRIGCRFLLFLLFIIPFIGLILSIPRIYESSITDYEYIE